MSKEAREVTFVNLTQHHLTAGWYYVEDSNEHWTSQKIYDYIIQLSMNQQVKTTFPAYRENFDQQFLIAFPGSDHTVEIQL